MPGNDDLFTALKMFRDGAQQLSTQRAITAATEQVNQVKQTELDEHKQRAAIQQISNGMVAQLAGIGAPATTIAQVAGALGPKEYANSNQMNADALLTGNTSLAQEAKLQQKFEQDPSAKLALIQAKLAARSPTEQLALRRLEDSENDAAAKKLKDYAANLDASKATSRSAFGQWAGVEARGERLSAVLGTPEKWKSMTEPELSLVGEGLIQMSKGGVGTKEELEAMRTKGLEVYKAAAIAKATNKPVPIDFSGYAGLYNNIVQREDSAAKEKMFDTIINRVQGGAHLIHDKKLTDQYKLTTSEALKQVGIVVDPNGIAAAPNGKIEIPELKPVLDAVDSAPKNVRDAMKDAKAGKPEAIQFLGAFGVSPSTPMTEAIKMVRTKIKARAFQ